MSDKFADQLEKTIIGKINSIEKAECVEDGVKIILESKITKMIERLKLYDVASADKLSKRYIEVVRANSKK